MSRPNYLWCYGRESDPRQMDGDGPRRQAALPWDAFAEQHKLVVHPKFIMDPGLSAWKPENWGDDAAVGKFVAKAERGVEVRPGDCLGCENWDRLCRLNPWDAVEKVCRLRKAGIHLGDVKRGRMIRYDSTDFADFIDFILETSRGFSESSNKSFRCQAKMDERARLGEAGELIHVTCLPCWIEDVDCKPGTKGARLYGSLKKPRHVLLKLKKEETKTIRLILELLRQGKGGEAIVAEMTRRGIPSPGGKCWSSQGVGRLRFDLRLAGYGRRQPRADPTGQIINATSTKTVWLPGYYPAVCTESELLALRPGRRGNLGFRGRDAEFPHPFKGLIVDAMGGSRYAVHLADTRNGKRRRTLVTRDGRNGRGESKGFDYQAFEECVFDKLREIDPQSILGESKAAQDIGELAGELRNNLDKQAEIVAEVTANGPSKILAASARQLEAREEELKEALSIAQLREDRPQAEAWGEQQTILATLQAAPDPKAARLNLRARLRETIDRIWLLVVPLQHARFGAVQIDFVTGGPVASRHYLILHKYPVNLPHCHRPGSWEVVSWPVGKDWRGIDLSSSTDAKLLSKLLASDFDLARYTSSHSAKR